MCDNLRCFNSKSFTLYHENLRHVTAAIETLYICICGIVHIHSINQKLSGFFPFDRFYKKIFIHISEKKEKWGIYIVFIFWFRFFPPFAVVCAEYTRRTVPYIAVIDYHIILVIDTFMHAICDPLTCLLCNNYITAFFVVFS